MKGIESILTEKGLSQSEIDETLKYLKQWEHENKSSSLLSHLKLKHGGLSNYVIVESKKVSNVFINWKDFFVDTIPLGIGAVATIPMGLLAATILALPLIKSFCKLFQVEFDILHSNIVVIAHSLSYDKERKIYRWIEIDKIIAKSIDEKVIDKGKEDTIIKALEFLKRNWVLEFDLKQKRTRLIEKLIISGN